MTVRRSSRRTLPGLLAAALMITGAAVTTAPSRAAAETSARAAIMAGPSLNFPAPPFGEVGAAYSDTLTVSGGTAPYTWAVSSGSLPAGLTLDAATGTLSGTPTASGSSTFTIQVTDADSLSATEETFLAIVPRVALNFPAPPPGQLGTAYSDSLVAAGGKSPYSWAVSAGSPPAGITLDSSTAKLSGTPTDAGTFTFTVQVTDANDLTATKVIALVIAPTIAVTGGTATFGQPTTLTATMTPATPTGSVRFTDVASTGPRAGQAVALGTATLSGGTATLATALPAIGANTITATYRGSPDFAVATSPATVVQVDAYAGEVVISSLRFSGPGGATDQYAVLYNLGPAVSLAGFTLTASSGEAETVPAAAPLLPTGHGYLIAGSGYSLSDVAAPDLTAASLGTAGFQVTAPDQPGTITDAVGNTDAQAGFFSGTPLPALTGAPADQYVWVRLRNGGVPIGTGSNAADYQLISTTGGIVGGLQSALGTPAPQDAASPAQGNASLVSTLLNPARAATAAPNFVYTPGAPGLLTIRRTLTNTSAVTVLAAVLRITSLSEANGPPQPGSATKPPNAAQFRVINPATPTTQIRSNGQAFTIHNLSINPPATASLGGGLNTTLTVPLPAGGLAPGAAITISLSFAVDLHGPYWFGYDSEVTTPLVTIITGPPGTPGAHAATPAPPRPVRAWARAPYASGHGWLPGRKARRPGHEGDARIRGRGSLAAFR